MHSVPVYENTLFWVTLWFISVDMNFWKPSLSFPFSALLGGSGFPTAPSNGLSVNPELPFSPIRLNLFHLHSLPTQCAWAAGEGWGRGAVSCLSHWTNAGGSSSDVSCHRHLCGRLQMPPLELRKCMLVASQVATAEREKHSSSGTACSCCTHWGDIFKLPLEYFGWHCKWKELIGSHPFL